MADYEDEFENDNFEDSFEDDFGGEFGETDFMGEEPLDERTPVLSRIKAGANDFKSEFSIDDNPSLIKDMLKASLPDEIKVVTDGIGDIEDSITDSWDKHEKNIKGAAYKMADMIDSIAPENSFIRNITSSIKDMTKTDIDYVDYRSEEDKNNEQIKSDIANLFVEQQSRNDLAGSIQTSMLVDTGNKSNKLLMDAATSLRANSAYNNTMTTSYYKRALELQYKHLFVARQQFKMLSGAMEMQASLLNTIIHNTALPDLVKVRSSEALMAAGRNQLGAELSKTIFNADEENWVTRITKRIKQGADQATGKIMEAGDLAETLGSDVGGMSIHKMVAMNAADRLKYIATDKLKDQLSKSKSGQKLILEAQRLNMDPAEYLQTKKNNKGGVYDKLMDGLSGIVSENYNEGGYSVTDTAMDVPVPLSKLMHDSVTKAIPTLLGDILQSVQTIERGTGAEAKVFDYESNKLVNRKSMGNRFTTTMEKQMDEKTFGEQSYLHDKFGSVLNEKMLSKFMEQVVEHSFSGKSFQISELEKNGFYKGLTRKEKIAIKGAMRKVTRSSTLGGKGEKEQDVYEAMRGIKLGMADPKRYIKQAMDNGTINDLVESGIVKYDKDTHEYTIDRDSLKQLNKNHLGKTDVFTANKRSRAKAVALGEVDRAKLHDVVYKHHRKTGVDAAKIEDSRFETMRGLRVEEWEGIKEKLEALKFKIETGEIDKDITDTLAMLYNKAERLYRDIIGTDEANIIDGDLRVYKKWFSNRFISGETNFNVYDQERYDRILVKDPDVSKAENELFEMEKTIRAEEDQHRKYELFLELKGKQEALKTLKRDKIGSIVNSEINDKTTAGKVEDLKLHSEDYTEKRGWLSKIAKAVTFQQVDPNKALEFFNKVSTSSAQTDYSKMGTKNFINDALIEQSARMDLEKGLKRTSGEHKINDAESAITNLFNNLPDEFSKAEALRKLVDERADFVTNSSRVQIAKLDHRTKSSNAVSRYLIGGKSRARLDKAISLEEEQFNLRKYLELNVVRITAEIDNIYGSGLLPKDKLTEATRLLAEAQTVYLDTYNGVLGNFARDLYKKKVKPLEKDILTKFKDLVNSDAEVIRATETDNDLKKSTGRKARGLLSAVIGEDKEAVRGVDTKEFTVKERLADAINMRTERNTLFDATRQSGVNDLLEFNLNGQGTLFDEAAFTTQRDQNTILNSIDTYLQSINVNVQKMLDCTDCDGEEDEDNDSLNDVIVTLNSSEQHLENINASIQTLIDINTNDGEEDDEELGDINNLNDVIVTLNSSEQHLENINTGIQKMLDCTDCDGDEESGDINNLNAVIVTLNSSEQHLENINTSIQTLIDINTTGGSKDEVNGGNESNRTDINGTRISNIHDTINTINVSHMEAQTINTLETGGISEGNVSSNIALNNIALTISSSGVHLQNMDINIKKMLDCNDCDEELIGDDSAKIEDKFANTSQAIADFQSINIDEENMIRNRNKDYFGEKRTANGMRGGFLDLFNGVRSTAEEEKFNPTTTNLRQRLVKPTFKELVISYLDSLTGDSKEQKDLSAEQKKIQADQLKEEKRNSNRKSWMNRLSGGLLDKSPVTNVRIINKNNLHRGLVGNVLDILKTPLGSAIATFTGTALLLKSLVDKDSVAGKFVNGKMIKPAINYVKGFLTGKDEYGNPTKTAGIISYIATAVKDGAKWVFNKAGEIASNLSTKALKLITSAADAIWSKKGEVVDAVGSVMKNVSSSLTNAWSKAGVAGKVAMVGVGTLIVTKMAYSLRSIVNRSLDVFDRSREFFSRDLDEEEKTRRENRKNTKDIIDAILQGEDNSSDNDYEDEYDECVKKKGKKKCKALKKKRDKARSKKGNKNKRNKGTKNNNSRKGGRKTSKLKSLAGSIMDNTTRNSGRTGFFGKVKNVFGSGVEAVSKYGGKAKDLIVNNAGKVGAFVTRNAGKLGTAAKYAGTALKTGVRALPLAGAAVGIGAGAYDLYNGRIKNTMVDAGQAVTGLAGAWGLPATVALETFKDEYDDNGNKIGEVKDVPVTPKQVTVNNVTSTQVGPTHNTGWNVNKTTSGDVGHVDNNPTVMGVSPHKLHVNGNISNTVLNQALDTSKIWNVNKTYSTGNDIGHVADKLTPTAFVINDMDYIAYQKDNVIEYVKDVAANKLVYIDGLMNKSGKVIDGVTIDALKDTLTNITSQVKGFVIDESKEVMDMLKATDIGRTVSDSATALSKTVFDTIEDPKLKEDYENAKENISNAITEKIKKSELAQTMIKDGTSMVKGVQDYISTTIGTKKELNHLVDVTKDKASELMADVAEGSKGILDTTKEATKDLANKLTVLKDKVERDGIKNTFSDASKSVTGFMSGIYSSITAAPSDGDNESTPNITQVGPTKLNLAKLEATQDKKEYGGTIENVTHLTNSVKTSFSNASVGVSFEAKLKQVKESLPWLYQNLGKPYSWGKGKSISATKMGYYPGYDCSGLSWSFYKRRGIDIPQGAHNQFAFSKFKHGMNLADAKPGDLIWFNHPTKTANRKWMKARHVAIYVGDGWMIHSSGSGNGTKLTKVFWGHGYKKYYVGFGTYTGKDADKLAKDRNVKSGPMDPYDRSMKVNTDGDDESAPDKDAKPTSFGDLVDSIKEKGVDGAAASLWKTAVGKAKELRAYNPRLKVPTTDKNYYDSDRLTKRREANAGKDDGTAAYLRSIGESDTAIPRSPVSYEDMFPSIDKVMKKDDAINEPSKTSVSNKSNDDPTVNVTVEPTPIDLEYNNKSLFNIHKEMKETNKENKKMHKENVKLMTALIETVKDKDTPTPDVEKDYYNPRDDHDKYKQNGMNLARNDFPAS